MNKQLLVALQKRNQERLETLQTQVQDPDLRAEDLEAIQTEITEITNQLSEIAAQLVEESDEENDEGTEEEKATESGESEQRNTASPENRSAAMSAIKTALSTRNAKSTKQRDKEVRSAFAKFVVGQITEVEARTLGVETQNGTVIIPEVIASEIITYSQEENLLRKYGTKVRTKGNQQYPILVKKAEANVTKHERHIGSPNNSIPETDIEFDEIYLSPVEFDALTSIAKKLINMSGVNVEEIVIEELKKAYVRKETNYMFNGDDVGNENPGALAKKAVAFYETEVVDLEAAGLSNKLYSQLVKMKGQVTTEVRKKAMWIVNGAALTALEGLLDANGRPLLYESPDGMGYKLLGHRLDYTDAASTADPSKPVFYFGDFKSFHIQDVIGGLQIQKLVEAFAPTNRIGFQIYNLLDGQLIYSPFEPSVYRYEVGAVKPGA